MKGPPEYEYHIIIKRHDLTLSPPSLAQVVYLNQRVGLGRAEWKLAYDETSPGEVGVHACRVGWASRRVFSGERDEEDSPPTLTQQILLISVREQEMCSFGLVAEHIGTHPYHLSECPTVHHFEDKHGWQWLSLRPMRPRMHVMKAAHSRANRPVFPSMRLRSTTTVNLFLFCHLAPRIYIEFHK